MGHLYLTRVLSSFSVASTDEDVGNVLAEARFLVHQLTLGVVDDGQRDFLHLGWKGSVWKELGQKGRECNNDEAMQWCNGGGKLSAEVQRKSGSTPLHSTLSVTLTRRMICKSILPSYNRPQPVTQASRPTRSSSSSGMHTGMIFGVKTTGS